MAENMEHGANISTTSTSKISEFKDCMIKILDLFTDFGAKLTLKEAPLKIHVSVDAVDVSCHSPAHVYSCLQQHILKLQAVSENVKALVDAEKQGSSTKANGPEGNNTCTTVTDLSDEEMVITNSEHLPPTAPKYFLEEDQSKSPADDTTVQIRASRSEIDRRISAFMERKQLEINENNVREFCNVIDCNQEDSCARTDAIFTPYPGFKSHVKVTRVVNTYGPQTRVGEGQGQVVEPPRRQASQACGNPAIEERLHNIEGHLKLPAEGPVPLNIYQRLKRLENRILELEGLSPEYFQSTSYLHKRPKAGSSQACSLSELDGKISAVKAALLKRVNEFGPSGLGTDCPL
ncbi:MAP3K12-binding inhibitory protein 1 [Aplochiton taeniatus]